MKKHKISSILIIAFILGGALCATAQDSLFIEAGGFKDGVIVKWFPLQDDLWLRLLDVGYKVERYDLNANGQTVSSSRVALAGEPTPFLPKDTIWFAEHADDEFGIMEAIGALLYDTTFQFDNSDILDATSMRYNFVVAEVNSRPAIAAAVGMAILDSTAMPDITYRYVVTSADNSITGFTDMQLQGGRSSNMPDFEPTFDFPDGLSLSEMSGEAANTEIPKIFAIAKPYGDSILLRWAPSTAKLWNETNKDGYTIERIERNNPDSRITQIAEVKPWPKDQITSAIEYDSMAMLAASNLYLEPQQNIEGGFFDKASLFENRWSFSLYAAERSPLASEILGLRYVDKTVEEGKQYIYIVKTPSVSSLFNAGVVELVNEYKPDPAPLEFAVEPGDGVLRLTWEKSQNTSNFSAYKIERSDDKGKSWKNLTPNLLAFVEDDQNPLSEFGIIDSVDANNKEYRYRLYGLNSFGDLSEAAEVKGEARDLTPPPQPLITSANYNDTTNTVIIRWRTPELPEDFGSFNVLLGSNVDENYETIATGISADKRSYSYQPASPLRGERPHYYRLEALDKSANSMRSLEKYMHVPDLTAPPPPAVVTGKIDDDGNIKIVWEHSTAEDLEGYWVYFANDSTQEFSILNTKILYVNEFNYQVEPKSLNEEIYFVVTAEDKANNRGYSSKILTLKRPDKVPPTAASMLPSTVKDGKIMVSWKPSGSKDATKYYLEKRAYGAGEYWQKVDTILSSELMEFRDTTWQLDTYYEYRVLVEDDAGNLSKYSPVTKGMYPFDRKKAMVNNLKATYQADSKQVFLAWDFQNESRFIPRSDYNYAIYKSTGNENAAFLTTIFKEEKSFSDNKVVEGVMYNYSVQVHFVNGKSGEMSPTKSVLIR